jgi:hypothetical protein
MAYDTYANIKTEVLARIGIDDTDVDDVVWTSSYITNPN